MSDRWNLISRMRKIPWNHLLQAAADMLEKDADIIAGLKLDVENRDKMIAIWERMHETREETDAKTDT